MNKRLLSLLLTLVMVLGMIPFGVIADEDSSLPFVQNLHLGDIDNGESPRTIYWDPVEGAERYAIYVKSPSGTICHGATVFEKEGIQSHFFYYMDYTWETFPSGTYEFEIWAVASDDTKLTQRTYYTYNFSNVIKVPNIEINVPLKVNEDFEVDLVNDASELHKSVYNNNYHVVVKNEEDIPSWMSIDEKGILRGTAPNTCNFGESFTIYFETGADARAFSVEYSLVSDGKEYAIQNLEFTRPYGCEYAYYRKQGYGDSVYGVWPVLDTVNYTIGSGIGSYSPKSNRESNIIKSVDWDFRKWNPETKKYELFDSDEMFNVGHYAMFMLIETKKSDADGKKAVFADDVSITVETKTVPAEDIGVLGYDGEEKLGVFLYKYYLYDYKPKINSVTVNGSELADGETVVLTNKNFKIETNYGNLYYVLQGYGCTMKQLSAYYLNGEKINVAALTPVDNGDGTSTMTYNRTLNGGDELTVESWLEVTWPNGYKDRVDEHTVTVMNVDADFESIYPAPTSTELTNKYTDLGTMDLGSSATNIEFKAFPKELSADAIEDGWTTGRSISVTRDGVEIYNKTYADNELFGWNLKDNVDEGGTYLITLRVFAQKGEQIVERTHKFRVYVKGSTIKTIVLEGVGTPVIGKSPSTINTVKCNTDGVVVKRMVWTYWTSEMGGVWVHMPSGSKFESGKRYAVEFELQTADGYSFTAKKEDMTVYINGVEAGKAYNYDTDEFGVDMEFEPITTPEFTTQPVGGEAPYGGKYTVNWDTNFTPCKIVVGEYNSLNQVVNQVEYSNTTTSVELPANQYGYVVIAYYNDANAKYSNKITITEVTPAFTTQPKGGEVVSGEKLTVNWATNFTPVKTVLMKVVTHPVDGTVTTRETLGTASTAEVGAGYDYYFIRAYTETGYVDSDKFYVTEKAEEEYAKGDVNGDGKVNMFDYVALKSHVLGKSILSDDKQVRADLNGDGKINMFDYVALKAQVIKG